MLKEILQSIRDDFKERADLLKVQDEISWREVRGADPTVIAQQRELLEQVRDLGIPIDEVTEAEQ